VTNRKGQPFALLGIHIGGSSAKQLKKVMEKEKMTWRSFVDAGTAGAGPIARQWNLSATPTFYVIDHKGVIRYKWAGPPAAKVLDAALDRLIQAAAASGKAITPAKKRNHKSDARQRRKDRAAFARRKALLARGHGLREDDRCDPATGRQTSTSACELFAYRGGCTR
jgi:hypothetical protein